MTTGRINQINVGKKYLFFTFFYALDLSARTLLHGTDFENTDEKETSLNKIKPAVLVDDWPAENPVKPAPFQ